MSAGGQDGMQQQRPPPPGAPQQQRPPPLGALQQQRPPPPGALQQRPPPPGAPQQQRPPPPQTQTAAPQPQVAHKRFQEQQAQVSAVTEIMRSNVDKILQRDEKLSDLDNRADVLEGEASEFGKHAGKLKRKYWWKNCKMLAILIGIGLVIILVIVVWAVSVKK